ncbi:oxygenase [Lithospermum erythrorhizon]|uniref:Oxygenase n=1 Tax=Lithospermum erythrorhizon TaxID=34254 RepID=A0AAV3NR40_LITER
MSSKLVSLFLESLETSNFLFHVFIIYVFSFVGFFLVRFTFRLKPWCNCDVCVDFRTSSWSFQYNNLCDWYTHLLEKSSSGTIHVHVLGNVITSNPENVEYILKTRFENYPKGKPFSTLLGDLLGKGIFNVDGEPWRFQRKMASLEINNVSIRSYAFEIVAFEISKRLIPLLEMYKSNGVVLDLQDVFQRFSFDNICKFSFGWDPNCLDLSLPVSELANAFDIASKLSAERAISGSSLVWKLKKLLNIGSEKRLKEAIKTIHLLADDVIMQKKRNMGSFQSNDLLSRFMGSVDDDKYLRDIVVSFLLAGRDTVASTLTSFFWLMANNKKARDTIRQEADKIMGGNQDFATIAQLKEMHYLHAAVYECMRLFPPVQFDSKFCQNDDILPDGTFVKKGTRVTYHPYAMGRMEKLWGQDCLEFKPERWLVNGCFKPENPFKYPVFQAGLRVCLGKEMAIMEVKSAALALINKFDFDVVSPKQEPIKFMPGLTATLKGGLHVLIKERDIQ